MPFQGEKDFQHDTPERLGVLLVNLGSPDAPQTGAVRRYLAEFLWDPRVIEMPRPLWWLILHGIILRIRPRRSAALYKKIWKDGPSPLVRWSIQQRDAIAARLQQDLPGPVEVSLGMRYGNPSIGHALEELRRRNVRRIVVLPLYPQYSATTTASVFDEVTRVLTSWRWLPELRFINHYHDQPGYIGVLAASVREFREREGHGEKLLMSFHGIPKRYIENGDPYFCECHKTARLLAETLGLADDQWLLTFQSRVGREEWLRPYTDETLGELARGGTRKVDAVCPGFSADCLETLEEIAQQNAELFTEQGGESLRYIPALNDRPDHVEFLAGLIVRHCAGWPEADEAPYPGDLQARARRAGECGYTRGKA